jgi:hypothetical protein
MDVPDGARGGLIPAGRRVLIITGHYGSGKTEFAVSLALHLASGRRAYPRLALVDLDIANPYFRSRERRALLENAGVEVYGSAYRGEITAELPALGADVRAPLQDAGCLTIIDAGGNDSGALVINQFSSYIQPGAATVAAVVNASRPETSTLEGAAGHIAAIEAATGMEVTHIVNNCHLLRETTVDVVRRGHDFCTRVCEEYGKKLLCDCYPAPVVPPEDAARIRGTPFPLGLHMRESWHDAPV